MIDSDSASLYRPAGRYDDANERTAFPEHETTRVGLAAKLYDVGKTAIPESILAEPVRSTKKYLLLGGRVASVERPMSPGPIGADSGSGAVRRTTRETPGP
jgi:hypothetical protein